jgi:hypothetical protein
MKSVLAAIAMLASATSVSLAQSQPNCGPNAPGVGDTYGKVFSGTLQAERGANRCRAMIYRHSAHRHHRHYHSRRYSYR